MFCDGSNKPCLHSGTLSNSLLQVPLISSSSYISHHVQHMLLHQIFKLAHDDEKKMFTFFNKMNGFAQKKINLRMSAGPLLTNPTHNF